MTRRDPDERFMRLALVQADVAGRRGEVPVGAVVVVGDRVVGRGANAPIATHDPTAHAEILAIRDAGARLGNYRLTGATLYCTVEPCLMCMSAAVHARIGRLVFGATDPKVGASSRLDGLRSGGALLNHRFEVTAGVLADESSAKLHGFFRERRASGTADDSSD